MLCNRQWSKRKLRLAHQLTQRGNLAAINRRERRLCEKVWLANKGVVRVACCSRYACLGLLLSSNTPWKFLTLLFKYKVSGIYSSWFDFNRKAENVCGSIKNCSVAWIVIHQTACKINNIFCFFWNMCYVFLLYFIILFYLFIIF